MKSNGSYLGDGLAHEMRIKKSDLSSNYRDSILLGALLYLTAELASNGDEWCRSEILRLIQLGKDLELQKQAEAA